MPQTPTADIRSILDPLQVPLEVKAQAWDAFHASRNDAEFRVKFGSIALPREAKAALWDAKAFTPEQTIQPKPATPAKGKDVPGLAETVLQLPGDLLRGGLKGAYSTALGLSKLAGQVPKETTLDDLAGPFSGGRTVIGEPRTPAEKVGFQTEQAAEFLVPSGLTAKAGKAVEGMAAVSKFPKLAGGIGRAAIEGAAAGGVAAAQTGSVDEAKKAALVAGGVSSAVPLLAKASRAAGIRIEKWLMGATKLDRENGFKVENVFKYDVGGSVQQTLQKTEKKLNDMTGLLQATLKGSPGTVRIGNAVLKARQDFMGNPQADEALARIVQRMEFDLNKRGVQLGKGILNVADANIAKQSVGDIGAWIHSPGGQVVSDADRITEEVANKFYWHLKREIESKALGPVKAINQSLGELMAIRQTAIRRFPVVDRQAALSLGDLFAMSSGKPGISILHRLSKSGNVANVLVKGSENLRRRIPETAKAAAAASQAQHGE